MGTEREFDAIASEAIRASDKEFFDEAMGAPETEADDEGDNSLETMGKGLEGQHEADDEKGEGEDQGAEPAEPEAKAEGDQDGKEGVRQDRDEQGKFKPKGEDQPGRVETTAERGLRGELVGERDKRKAVEAEFATYRAENDRRFAALEARLTQAAPQPQPKPEEQPAAKAEVPDRWMDPDGYDRYQREQTILHFNQQRAAASFEEAKAEHGTAFDEAYGAANALPDAVAKPLLDRVLRSPNPARTLMTWHSQQKAYADIGNDPTAYRSRIEANTRDSLMKDPEFRKQVLEQLQAEARGNNGGSPRTEIKVPPSLSTARGGGVTRAATGDLSDAGLFDEVMR